MPSEESLREARLILRRRYLREREHCIQRVATLLDEHKALRAERDKLAATLRMAPSELGDLCRERDALKAERDRLAADTLKALAPLGVELLDPPDGGDVSLPEQVVRLVERYCAARRQLAEAHEAIHAVDVLMRESHGVAGLHRNGDVAPWDELLAGGRFEEWLLAFSKARAALPAREENDNG